jgi:hypothetical protein
MSKSNKIISNRIIGMVYNMCVMHRQPVADIMCVFISITQDCGVFTDNYKNTLANNPTFLIRTMAIATHHDFHKHIKHIVPNQNIELFHFFGTIINRIIYSEYKWPDENFKNNIISIIFSNDENLGIRTNISALLRDEEFTLDNLDVAYVIGGLYGLIKFVTNQKSADISVLVEDAINSLPEKFVERVKELETSKNSGNTFLYKYIITGLIGASIGYTTIYQHQPFFNSRNQLDLCVKLYLIYLYSEKSKIKLGVIKHNNELAVRWLHMPDEPSPIGIWAETFNVLAKYKCVSYVEHNDVRYQKLSQVPWDCDKEKIEELNRIDELFINKGKEILTKE